MKQVVSKSNAASRVDDQQLEAARKVILAAVDALKKRRDADSLEASNARKLAGGIGVRERWRAESIRNAVSLLASRARLGELDGPIGDAFGVFSAYWTAGDSAGGPLRLPSPIVLRRWLEEGISVVPPKMKALQYVRHNESVGAARAEVILAIKDRLKAPGSTLDEAIRALLAEANLGGEAGRKERELLRRARDPRGLRGRDGLPSQRTLQRWLCAADLVPKAANKSDLTKPWMSAADRIRLESGPMSAKALHVRLIENWRSEWGSAPITYTSVARYVARRPG